METKVGQEIINEQILNILKDLTNELKQLKENYIEQTPPRQKEMQRESPKEDWSIAHYYVKCPNEGTGFFSRPHNYLGNGCYNHNHPDTHCRTCGATLIKEYVGVFCKNCGKYISSSQNHCSRCGSPITEKPKNGWFNSTVEGAI